MKTVSLVLSLCLLLACNSQAQQTELQTRIVTSNLDTPWEVLWGPDDHLWITERRGVVSRVHPESGEVFQLLDIQDVVWEFSEAGMLGMALHPEFDTDPYVFIAYNFIVNNERKERLSRFYYNESTDKLEDEDVLYDEVQASNNHNGARLLIDPSDNTLYMTTGEIYDLPLSQDLSSPNGKTLRFKLDGSVPPDNPFVDTPNANPYIWSYGHRNHQGLAFGNGRLYSSEHGQSIADELNEIVRGRNYGWPEIEGFCDTPQEKVYCNANNVAEPMAEYESTYTYAVAGIDYYPSDGPIAPFRNCLFMACLKTTEPKLVQVHLSEDGSMVEKNTIHFESEFGRLRDVCVSPDGRLFFSTSNLDGRGRPPFNQEGDKIIEVTVTTVDVQDQEEHSGSLFPNPCREFLYSNDIKNESFFVADVQGKLWLHSSKQPSGTVSVQQLPAGVYILRTKKNVQLFTKL